jgi:hypothetical protein
MRKRNVRKSNRSCTQTCQKKKKRVKLVCHHIHGREIHRWDEPWNHAWICPNCHDLVHDGEYIIEGNFQGELFWHKKGEESITGMDASPYNYNNSLN